MISTCTSREGRGGAERPLAGIAEQGMQIAGAASETTALGEEQVVGLSEVNSAVNQMDQVTIQNAEMVEEATAADRSLCKESNALATMMDTFRIGGDCVSAGTGADEISTKAQSSISVRTGRRTIAAIAGGGRPAATFDASWEDF